MTRPLPSLLLAILVLWAALCAPTDARAQDEEVLQQQRDEAAEDSFNTIMMGNAASQAAARAAPRRARAPSPTDTPALVPTQAQDGEVELPLDQWSALRRDALRAQDTAGEPAPAVVLGRSTFTGEALDGALRLRLDLQVTLGAPGVYKQVPLVGEQVVVVGARADGRDVPLSRTSGYHVWVTQETGEHQLSLDLLVPAQGRRGSIEYDFKIAKTPATTFSCRFPSEGLQPRMRNAVRTDVRTESAGTVVEATLEPTSRLHLVGFRDLGDGDSREARLYVEGLNLLSLSDGALEVFSVLRYNILYAGNRTFTIAIPPGLSVVSAEGQGAFRYSVEDRGDQGSLLLGETAYPIRNSYEISLRLRRDLPAEGGAVPIALPRTQGVEREHGWLAAEVTGNLKLDEVDRGDTVAVDVRQLPLEMVSSAVSPVLRAWRYHSADATLVLEATPLPEQDPASASIDTIRADTVVSPDGGRLTDVRITLRNTLRHSLAVRLPEGAVIRSTLLDGQPTRPSKNSDGALLFGLKRSNGPSGALSLQLVYEEDAEAPGLLGRVELALPTVELPVSSVEWSAWLPRRNLYSALEGELEEQHLAGSGRWYRGPMSGGAGGDFGWSDGELGGAPVARAGESGAMPVRIDLPKSGRQLTHRRFWLDAEEPVVVRAWTASSALLGPIGLAGGLGVVLLFAWGAPAVTRMEPAERRTPLRLGALAVGLCALAVAVTTSASWLVLAAMVGLGVASARMNLHRTVPAAARSAWARARAEGAGLQPGAWSQRSVLSRAALALTWLGIVGFGGILLLRLVTLLPQPLGG